MKCAVFYAVARRKRRVQCPASFGSSSSRSTIIVLRGDSISSSSSSLKIGSETTYFSVAQLPRSRSRQRSLQKGKSPCTVESVGVLQIGHLCNMTQTLLFKICNSARKGSLHQLQ